MGEVLARNPRYFTYSLERIASRVRFMQASPRLAWRGSRHGMRAVLAVTQPLQPPLMPPPMSPLMPPKVAFRRTLPVCLQAKGRARQLRGISAVLASKEEVFCNK